MLPRIKSLSSLSENICPRGQIMSFFLISAALPFAFKEFPEGRNGNFKTRTYFVPSKITS